MSSAPYVSELFVPKYGTSMQKFHEDRRYILHYSLDAKIRDDSEHAKKTAEHDAQPRVKITKQAAVVERRPLMHREYEGTFDRTTANRRNFRAEAHIKQSTYASKLWGVRPIQVRQPCLDD